MSVDIDRIVYFAKRKNIPTKEIEKLADALAYFKLTRDVERLVTAAYGEGFNDGLLGVCRVARDDRDDSSQPD